MKVYRLSSVLAVSLLAASGSLTADAVESSIIPNAKPGECYAKALIPAKFETHTEKVLVKEASERLEVVPAKFGTSTQKVLIKEASEKLQIIPATFKNVTDKVQVREEETLWRTSLKNRIPVSPEILAAAKAGGAPIDTLQSGECVREYFQPAKYEQVKENYVRKEGYDKLKIIPAKYEYVEEKVLIKEPYQKLVKVPATYETVTEKILIEPEKTIWKKSQCNGTDDCGVMCLVTIPAKYKTVTKRVVKTPPTTKVVDVPAVYKTIKVRKLVSPARVEKVPVPEQIASYTRTQKVSDPVFTWAKVGGKKPAGYKYTGHQICKLERPAAYKTLTKTVVETPASTKAVEIPAQYTTIKVTTVVKPAEVKRIEIPAVYKDVVKREMVEPSRVVWKRVVCKSSITSATIIKLQKALKEKGYYKGPIDGIVGRLTREAVKAYQKDNGMPVGGITYQVLKSLGIN